MATSYPLIKGGGFEPSGEQLKVLEVSGYPLANPVAYEAPKTVADFDLININNFTMYFWFNGPKTPSPDYRNKFVKAGTPCFERLRILYPGFVNATRHIVQGFLPIDVDIKMHNGVDGDDFTRAEFDIYYDRLVKPRFFTAWQTMSQLFDKDDPNYRAKLAQYPGISSETAIYFSLTL